MQLGQYVDVGRLESAMAPPLLYPSFLLEHKRWPQRLFVYGPSSHRKAESIQKLVHRVFGGDLNNNSFLYVLAQPNNSIFGSSDSFGSFQDTEFSKFLKRRCNWDLVAPPAEQSCFTSIVVLDRMTELSGSDQQKLLKLCDQSVYEHAPSGEDMHPDLQGVGIFLLHDLESVDCCEDKHRESAFHQSLSHHSALSALASAEAASTRILPFSSDKYIATPAGVVSRPTSRAY